MRIKNLFIFLWCINGYGQILNIDREIVVDSLPRSIIGVIDLSFSVDKQRRDIIELTQQTEIDFLNKENTNILIVLAHTDLVFNGVNVL